MLIRTFCAFYAVLASAVFVCCSAMSFRHIRREHHYEGGDGERVKSGGGGGGVFIGKCPFNSLLACTDYERLEEALARIQTTRRLSSATFKHQQQQHNPLQQPLALLYQNSKSRHDPKRIFIG